MNAETETTPKSPICGTNDWLGWLKNKINKEADTHYARYDRMNPGEEREKTIGIVRGLEIAEIILMNAETDSIAGHVERIINRRIEEAKTSRNWNAEHCYKNSEEQWFGSQMALMHLKDELIQVGILPK